MRASGQVLRIGKILQWMPRSAFLVLFVTLVVASITCVPAGAAPALRVRPVRALADLPVRIVASGLAPDQPAEIRATTRDALGDRWQSSVTCVAGATGTIDLTTCSPSGGTYNVVDGMGLFWSMQPVASQPVLFFEPDAASTEYDFSLVTKGRVIATARAQRVFAAPGVRRIPLTRSVVGTAFQPAGPGKHPAVILVGGSGGGHPMDALAALLASRGYETLSLEYFVGATRSVPGVSKDLVNIPIETVQRGIAWLQRQPSVDPARIGIAGHSRGSELALLSGAYFPQIKAVVALAPSTLVWPGLNADYAHTYPSWTYRGKPFTVMVSDNALFGKAYAASTKTHKVVVRPAFEASLRDRAAVKASFIPVERTRGPILFVAGDDDDLWPSTTFAQMGMKRLRDDRHPYHDEYLHYPNAGHWMFEIYVPLDGRVVLNVPRFPTSFGGTAAGDARASEESWPQIVNFFASALGGPRFR